MPNRAKGYEGCPGCVAVDVEEKACAPGNLKYCLSAQSKQKGWHPGACPGCLLLADGEPCASGNAKRCAVSWERNK